MKSVIFSFLCILFLISLVGASLNIDKGSLRFELDVGKENCQTVKVFSESYEGRVSIRDIWARSFDEQGNFRKYNFSAEDHGLLISYINEITDFEDEVDVMVCLKGEKSGQYKGALIFTPEADGQFVVEIGTWLFVNITKNEEETSVGSGGSSGGSGGGGGGSGGGSPINLNLNVEDETQENSFDIKSDSDIKETEEELDAESSAGITGAVVGGGNSNWRIISMVMVIIVIAVVIVYNHNKIRKRSL